MNIAAASILERSTSHVVALPPDSLRVGPRDQVERVHVAVHAHRNAFLKGEWLINGRHALYSLMAELALTK